MKNKYVFVGCLLTILLLVSLGATSLFTEKNRPKDDGKITVVTSFYPMYIAAMNVTDGISGVELSCLSEPQTGCLHDFQLTPEDMKLLSHADVFIINGGGIESFLTEVADAYPKLQIVNASRGLGFISETDGEDGGRNRGREEENSHVWMSIANYRMQVAAIAEGLAVADEAHTDAYLDNAKRYDKKLAKLYEEEKKLADEVRGTKVVLFHEAFSYLAEDLGLVLSASLDLDDERQVSAGEILNLMSVIETEDAKYILAEELYGKEIAERVTAEKEQVEIVFLDPLTRGEMQKDSYIEGMKRNICQLQEIIR